MFYDVEPFFCSSLGAVSIIPFRAVESSLETNPTTARLENRTAGKRCFIARKEITLYLSSCVISYSTSQRNTFNNIFEQRQ
jgi:hypothetical protein